MRIYADLRCLQDPNYSFRGIGTHASTVLRQARRHFDEPVEIVGLLDEELGPVPEPYQELTDRTQHCLTPRPDADGAIFLQPSPLTHEQARLAPLLGRAGVFSCSIVYDFIPLEEERYLPTPALRWGYLGNLFWLKYYDLYCPISAYTGRRLREVLGAPADSIEVTGAGVRGDFYRFDPAEQPRLCCTFHPRCYFLVVGGEDQRKNLDCALRAHCALLARTGRQTGLVVVGHYSAGYRDRARELFRGHGGADHLLEFVSGVSDADLAALYHYAIATICPSRIEGFSLPVVEALASGCPVLAATCAAQRELVPQPEALFDPDDDARLANLLEELTRKPELRGQLLEQQRPVAPQFAGEAVAGRLWSRVRNEYRAWRQRKRPARPVGKPRLALLTPYPPDRSGVADYTADSLESLARHAVVDVYTDARPEAPPPCVRRFEPLSPRPYVGDEYDRVLAVVGNSHFHTRIIEYHCRYGGACLMHDNRLAELYSWWRGPEAFARMATRRLGRPVGVEESQVWVHNPDRLPSLFFDEILTKAEPFLVHSRGVQAQVLREYGKQARYLPFCCYRHFTEAELGETSRREVRARLGLPPDRVAIASFGIVAATKAPLEMLWALEHLHAWGVPADLWIVGSAEYYREPLRRAIEQLKLERHVHLLGDWVADSVYRDFLLAADFALQLRTFGLGGVSGAVSDCISAGLPTVCNEDLAAAVEAPDYVLRVPDHLSATLIAEQLANAYEAGRHRVRLSPARDEYLGVHNFDNYAAQLMQYLGLG
jgi:glycosyltransferase involved in cell wall biosynthesis